MAVRSLSPFCRCSRVPGVSATRLGQLKLWVAEGDCRSGVKETDGRLRLTVEVVFLAA